MYKTIKTTKENKEIVTSLTNKLGLGAENVIARIAIAHSIAQNQQLIYQMAGDSQGKEYTRNVLFGENASYYEAMICQLYNVYKTDKDLPKMIKAHLDDGLEKLSEMELTNDTLINLL
jgi:DNA sulfur modification protein DndE